MPVNRDIDEATLRGVAKGDVAAQRALLLMYQDRIVALCYGVAGASDEAAAHGVALDVFLLVFVHLKKLPGLGPARLSTWLLTVAAQRAVAAQRVVAEHQLAVAVPTTISAEHAALLTQRAQVLAARAWPEVRAQPGFVDQVLAAAMRAAAAPPPVTAANVAPVGLFGSTSARRISVIIAVAAVAAFAMAMLRSDGTSLQSRATLAELVGQGRAASQPATPNATPVPVLSAQAVNQPDLAALRDQAQRQEIAALKAQVAQLQAELDSTKTDDQGTGYPHPRPEVLRRWAADCHTRYDNLDVSQKSPLQVTGNQFGLTETEVPGFNAALREVHATWLMLVRAAYVEITGDAVGVKVRSPAAMILAIENKGAKNEVNTLRERIANERAGLVPAPAADAAMSARERQYRAYANLGDTIETALAKRIGAARARAVRGNGWAHHTESTGCAR